MGKKLKPKISRKTFNALDDDMVEVINRKAMFVSDGIGDDYKRWIAENPIALSAITGMGKNFFIEDVLIKYAKELGLNILIVSNRIALNRQVKERIAIAQGCEHDLEKYTAIGLDDKESFGNVGIISYQKLNIYLEDILKVIRFKHYSIVVFDECHFFTSDALFNNNTYKILQNSLRMFRNAIRIYMSATIEEVFPIILQQEKLIIDDSSNFSYINNPYSLNSRPKKILYYNFQRNYNYIQPKYFEDKKDILEIIKQNDPDSKWLIFVANKNDGDYFVKEIGNDAIFITADSKNSEKTDGKAYSELIKEEKFSSRVLVSTSVLDNGVNFKDPLLKNIVIFTHDKTEFLQMLGRKRHTDNEKVNLYICARNASYFNAKLYTIKKQIQAICCFKDNHEEFSRHYFIGSASGDELFKGLFYFDKELKVHLNNLAEKKIFNDKTFYEKMINELNSGCKDAFIYEQLSWMGLEKKYDPCSWVTYVDSDKNKAEFLQFLDKHCNVRLTGQELDKFQEDFKNHVNVVFGEQPGDRKDRSGYKVTKMRKIFKSYSLDYVIKVENKTYILKKA